MKQLTRSQRWEDRALARYLKEHENEFAAERLCIVLHNPDEEAKLTKVLIEGLWPGVVQAVAQSRFTTSVGSGKTAVEGVRTVNGRHTRRELTVMIEDRDRPIMSPWYDPPNWYSRIILSVDGYGYRTQETTILSFRHDMSRAKLDRLLREPYLQGNPPELSWSDGRDGEPGQHVMKFSGGKGWGWGAYRMAESGSGRRGQTAPRRSARKSNPTMGYETGTLRARGSEGTGHEAPRAHRGDGSARKGLEKHGEIQPAAQGDPASVRSLVEKGTEPGKENHALRCDRAPPLGGMFRFRLLTRSTSDSRAGPGRIVGRLLSACGSRALRFG